MLSFLCIELYLQHHLNANVQILGRQQCLSPHSVLYAPVFNNKIVRAISHRKELNPYLNALGMEEMYKVELNGVTIKSVS